jgi:hypothetical protein
MLTERLLTSQTFRALAGVAALVHCGAALALARGPIAGPAHQSGATVAQPPALAVVRRDGVLIPFATYRDGRWRNAWPTPRVNRDAPLTVADIPADWWGGTPRMTWRLIELGASTQRALRVRGAAPFTAHCQLNIGLETDHTPSAPPPPLTVQPYPKDGLAVDGPADVDAIAVIDPASDEGRRAISGVAGVIDDAERAALRRGEGLGIWPRAAEREQAATSIEALYRGPLDGSAGGDVYYFEAVRRYPPAGGDDRACPVAVWTSGWLAPTAAGPMRPFDVRATMVACDFRAVEALAPLGSVRVAGQSLWAVQLSGWGRERYALLRVTRDRARIEHVAHGGGC